MRSASGVWQWMRFERHGLKGMGAEFMTSPGDEQSDCGEEGMERGGRIGRRDASEFELACVTFDTGDSMLHVLDVGGSCKLSRQR